jgi:tetratricopeptide (TPR) repeat protein
MQVLSSSAGSRSMRVTGNRGVPQAEARVGSRACAIGGGHGDYKYIEAPRLELYNLAADPHEQNNLFGKDAPKGQALRGGLHKLLAGRAPKHLAPAAPISPRTRALLASLGYVSGGQRTDNSGVDPKDRLAEYRLYEDAQLALYNRRLHRAVAILRALLARDPHNTLARRDLGGTYVDQHQYAKARACFEQVVAAAPDDYMAQFELGIADKQLGLYPEALVHLQAACKVAPEAEQCRRELESLKKQPQVRQTWPSYRCICRSVPTPVRFAGDQVCFQVEYRCGSTPTMFLITLVSPTQRHVSSIINRDSHIANCDW